MATPKTKNEQKLPLRSLFIGQLTASHTAAILYVPMEIRWALGLELGDKVRVWIEKA